MPAPLRICKGVLLYSFFIVSLTEASADCYEQLNMDGENVI